MGLPSSWHIRWYCSQYVLQHLLLHSNVEAIRIWRGPACQPEDLITQRGSVGGGHVIGPGLLNTSAVMSGLPLGLCLQ